MGIILHVDSSPIPEGEIESFEDAWDEIESYPNIKDEKSYILLENRKSDNFLAELGVDGWYDFPRLAMTPIGNDQWGLVVNDDPEKIVTTDELKQVVRAFFENN